MRWPHRRARLAGERESLSLLRDSYARLGGVRDLLLIVTAYQIRLRQCAGLKRTSINCPPLPGAKIDQAFAKNCPLPACRLLEARSSVSRQPSAGWLLKSYHEGAEAMMPGWWSLSRRIYLRALIGDLLLLRYGERLEYRGGDRRLRREGDLR